MSSSSCFAFEITEKVLLLGLEVSEKEKKGGYYRLSFRSRLKRIVWAWQPFRRQSHRIISQHWISFLSHPLLRFNSPEVVFLGLGQVYVRTQKPSNDLGVTAFKYLVDQPGEEIS